MSSPVIAVQNKAELKEVGHEKLLVLAFMRSVPYSYTCEYMKPILDSIAKNMAKDKVDFRTIDIANNEFKDIVNMFKVEATPAFQMIKQNKPVGKLVTTTNKQELTNSITAAI